MSPCSYALEGCVGNVLLAWQYILTLYRLMVMISSINRFENLTGILVFYGLNDLFENELNLRLSDL